MIKRTHGDPVDYEKGSMSTTSVSDGKVSPGQETNTNDGKQNSQPTGD